MCTYIAPNLSDTEQLRSGTCSFEESQLVPSPQDPEFHGSSILALLTTFTCHSRDTDAEPLPWPCRFLLEVPLDFRILLGTRV